MQECITSLLSGTEGDNATHCSNGSCVGSLVWDLEGMRLPQVVVVELHRVSRSDAFTVSRPVEGVVQPAEEWDPQEEGICGAFEPARPAKESQLGYPDMAEAQRLMIGGQEYELRVVHCGDAMHHVVYFRAASYMPQPPEGGITMMTWWRVAKSGTWGQSSSCGTRQPLWAT